MDNIVECPECQGQGYVLTMVGGLLHPTKCEHCNGKGVVESDSVIIKIIAYSIIIGGIVACIKYC